MDKYKTGNTVPIKLRLITNMGEQILDGQGKECQAGLGTLTIRLIELVELRRKKSSWLYQFFNGRAEMWRLDEGIKEISEAMDYITIQWASYR